jgi:predicted lipoprotein with Yx(FWY)xxD motif
MCCTRLAGFVAALVGLAFATSAKAEPFGPARIAMSDDGPILTTPEGMTLYTLGADSATPGKSVCSHEPDIDFADPTAGFGTYKLPGWKFIKSCTAASPPFLAPSDAVASGDWTLFERPEGGLQWVHRTQPLYTSTKDMRPGDRNGVARDQIARRGLRLAKAPTGFPPGFAVKRVGETLVLATENGRPVYTPRGARVQKACAACSDVHEPLRAPALIKLSGDWSVSEGAGVRQYAFRGTPLYAAPESMTDREMLDSGRWDMVVLRETAGVPSAIKTRYHPLIGDIYTTREGRTLYIYTCTAPDGANGAPGCDDPGGPAGYWAAMCGSPEECARRWRPYRAEADAKPVGDWSLVEVAYPMFAEATGQTYPPGGPTVKAWAWRGRPLYTYYEDEKPGDIWGHQLRWFALASFLALPVPGREVQF